MTAAALPTRWTDFTAYTNAPVAQLRPWPENPRRIDKARFAALKASMQADPEMLRVRPLVALKDGTVLMGNMRLRAAQALKWPTIPTAYVDLDPAQARQWAIRDNNAYGEWDEAALAELLYTAQEAGDDLALYGFAEDELARLMGTAEPTVVAGTVEDAIPEPPEDPVTTPGTLWQIGPHRLLCGDAASRADAERLLAGARPRLVVTSPPYNQGLDRFKPSGMQKENPAWVRRMAGAYDDSMPEETYQDGQADVLDLLYDLTARDASVFYNHKHRYREQAVVSPLLWLWRTRWKLRQEIIWDRGGSITLNARMFMPQDERIYWLHKGEFYFLDTAEAKALGTIWAMAPRNEEKVSAPFPNELPARIIRCCSQPDDLVWDPYGGSGTTQAVAADEGRVGYAIERNPAYCDVALERLQRRTGEPAVRADGATYDELKRLRAGRKEA